MIKKGRIKVMEVNVAIHAPLIPRESSNKGPKQQADAAIAEKIASKAGQKECRVKVACSDFITTVCSKMD